MLPTFWRLEDISKCRKILGAFRRIPGRLICVPFGPLLGRGPLGLVASVGRVDSRFTGVGFHWLWTAWNGNAFVGGSWFLDLRVVGDWQTHVFGFGEERFECHGVPGFYLV